MPISTLFVGIDVSLKTNQVCSINFNQDVFFSKKFDNSPSGTEKLIRLVLDVLYAHREFTKVIFCLEATNVYHIHPASTLAMDPRLSAYDSKVYAENAKSIENYKRTFLDREKTDPEDAFLCADYARVGKCKKSHPVIGYQKTALQRLTRQRKHVAEQLGKEKQFLSSNLFLRFSALKVNPDDVPFSNIYGKTSSVMLNDFLTNEEIVNAHLSDLVERISELSKNRFDDPESVARQFKKLANDSYLWLPLSGLSRPIRMNSIILIRKLSDCSVLLITSILPFSLPLRGLVWFMPPASSPRSVISLSSKILIIWLVIAACVGNVKTLAIRIQIIRNNQIHVTLTFVTIW